MSIIRYYLQHVSVYDSSYTLDYFVCVCELVCGGFRSDIIVIIFEFKRLSKRRLICFIIISLSLSQLRSVQPFSK